MQISLAPIAPSLIISVEAFLHGYLLPFGQYFTLFTMSFSFVPPYVLGVSFSLRSSMNMCLVTLSL